MTQHRPIVVVGVDGSTESVDALTWALDYADSSGAIVRAVLAWQYPTSYGYVPDSGYDDMETESEALLRRTVEKATAERPGAYVEELVVDNQLPGVALCDMSRTADMLVVGRGSGGLRRVLLGSVSTYCVHHAECPVVIIRHRDERS